MTLLAHSAQRGVPEQSYREHVLAVNRDAKQHIADATHFFSGTCEEKDALLKAVDEGSLYHDLGKADASNQSVLNHPNSKERLPLNHCDAGTAYLWSKKAVNAALLSYCHHIGLFSLSEELKKSDGKLAFRDAEISDDIDRNIKEYVAAHSATMPENEPTKDTFCLKGFSLRIVLSCLVDADHHNTASHYGQEADLQPCPVRWDERLDALNHYVRELKKGQNDDRNELRNEIYKACQQAPIDPSIKCCDAPVGSGKTTAIMAHLLNVAAKKKLRHVFVVLPYTNIIKQSVDVYRNALVLPNENPEDIVAAHYHQAEFSDLSSRHLSTLWRSPIVVTSAVQFFETLAASGTSKLRKLHELPGSAVFIDESHAAMPLHIWPQQWAWMNKLAGEWGCYFTLASGSLVRFWEFDGFSEEKACVPNILPKSIQEKTKAFESRRVVYPERIRPLNRQGLISFILSKPGPRLVIVNTVQSAAVIAHELTKSGHETLHLSTALAPVDRDTVLTRIHRKLEFKNQPDWVLVATSCVEAGVDFSFKTAFRESATLTSLIQTSGRANRHGKESGCQIIDFRVRDPLLNKHPAFDISRTVLGQMFDEELLNKLSPAELASESLNRELNKTDLKRKADRIRKLERLQDYREVSRLCRIIDADTRVVVVSPSVVKKLQTREKVPLVELLRNSVQLWSKKIEKLELVPIRGHAEIYSLGSYAYDPDFLGYMEGLIPLVYQDEEGLII